MKQIPYGHQWIDEDDIKSVVEVLHSDWITQGPKIREFENALCKYTGAKYAVVVSSGTAALHLACLAIGIESGDEVITSPITFVASANCVLYCGGKPVFADVQKETINIDPEEIRKKVTKKTKAIIPVHFAGHPCDMQKISQIAKKHHLSLIEDASHALGAEYRANAKCLPRRQTGKMQNAKWIKIGSCKHSDMAVFSFHPVKHITTGEGGAALTNRKDLYERLLMLRNHGITKNKNRMKRFEGPWYYEMQELGFNYRITDFQCALGLNQLKKLKNFVKRRREIVTIYNRELSKIEAIDLPVERPYVRSSWHIYYVRLKDPKRRKTIFEKLRKSGIGVQVHYIPIHLQPYYKEKLGYREGDFPQAEDYYQKAITLPLYPKMKNRDIDWVIKNLIKLL